MGGCPELDGTAACAAGSGVLNGEHAQRITGERIHSNPATSGPPSYPHIWAGQPLAAGAPWGCPGVQALPAAFCPWQERRAGAPSGGGVQVIAGPQSPWHARAVPRAATGGRRASTDGWGGGGGGDGGWSTASGDSGRPLVKASFWERK